MSNVNIEFPELTRNGAWQDYRSNYAGGFGWRGERSLDSIKYIVIHHTAGSKTRNVDKDVDNIANNHINSRKWGGIGYHVVISSEEVNGLAKVAYVGDVSSIRAHAPNMKGALGIPQRQGNVYLLGIAIVGNFVDSLPSDAQLRSLHRVCHDLIYRDARFTSLENWDNVKSHKDFDATSCPGQIESFRSKIINPPKKPNESTLSEYEKALQNAKRWNDLVGEKYGQKILGRVDDTPISRNDFILALHRYTNYLRKSDNV